MDADEFFNFIFDKLEQQLKGTPKEQTLKNFFGGEISNQVISKNCEHVSERTESFFTLSIEVKGKKSILESLELFVRGDILEGDNKYHCDACNAKVNAVRRSCVSTLPDNLIIHQKRFEFDLEQLKRVKVNDYCEFPMMLDMKPYMRETLMAKENAAAKVRKRSEANE
jgi:ubiquitin carboxyl-terminal hydrolase 34